jgi:hypothetical protein
MHPYQTVQGGFCKQSKTHLVQFWPHLVQSSYGPLEPGPEARAAAGPVYRAQGRRGGLCRQNPPRWIQTQGFESNEVGHVPTSLSLGFESNEVGT